MILVGCFASTLAPFVVCFAVFCSLAKRKSGRIWGSSDLVGYVSCLFHDLPLASWNQNDVHSLVQDHTIVA